MKETILHALEMGGYAQYVWPAYLLVAGIFVGHVYHLKHQAKKLQQTLKLALLED